MLQKKRDQFRKQIRRTQLDKYREQRRKLLQQKQVNFQVLQQVDQIFVQLEELLKSISIKRQGQSKISSNKLKMKQHYGEKQQEDGTFYDIMQCFQRLKCIAPSQFEQLFTNYMKNQQSAQRIMNILCDLIQNEFINQQDEEEIGMEERPKYSEIMQQRTVYEIIKFIDTLGFMVIDFNILRGIIDGVWRLLTEGTAILYSEVDQYGCLRYTLSILAKLLQDTKQDQLFKYMDQKGIGSQLVLFIDRLRKLQVPLEVHQRLLQLIDNYLIAQFTFCPNPDKVGEVTIQTSKVNEKQILLVYCIVFIDKSQEILYSLVFSCISRLLELYEFLANNLKQEYWEKVCKLILHQKRDIQVQALNLLNDFTFHSQHVLDYLLKSCHLFDMLYSRLMKQKSTNDQFVTSNVQKISYIICNSLLTDQLPLKKQCLQHYIWEEIFLSFHPSNKLFPLIMTMPYFLQAQGHKNFQKYLRPFLETLRNFQWKQCRYSDAIKDAIMRTFYNAQQWQEHEYQLLLKILSQQGFLFLVQDLVEEEDLKLVKDIQIE